MNIYEEALNSIKNGKSMFLVTENIEEEGSIEDLNRSLKEITLELNDTFNVVKPTIEKKETLTVKEPLFPKERLIVLGGGHIGLALCDFASKCGFEVTIVDDRPAFANNERFPLASSVVCENFTKAILDLKVTPFDYVVVITRGHRNDAECLRALLPGHEPAYLGMIGSRRRVKGLLEMLIEEGYDKDKISRICSPIGLKIGAVTPEEITISILSEIIAYKRLPEVNKKPRIINNSDLDYYMIEYLAKDHSPKSIVTVIETVGSTPRGTGAKMCVDPHGNIKGSIGGGCSEGAVIRDAIDIIGTGEYKTFFIDMRGEVAESEGMVCGGTMTVLIEDGSSL